MCVCLSYTLYWGPGPQPRHVPWLGIEPATLWFAGWHLQNLTYSNFTKSENPSSFVSRFPVMLESVPIVRSVGSLAWHLWFCDEHRGGSSEPVPWTSLTPLGQGRALFHPFPSASFFKPPSCLQEETMGSCSQTFKSSDCAEMTWRITMWRCAHGLYRGLVWEITKCRTPWLFWQNRSWRCPVCYGVSYMKTQNFPQDLHVGCWGWGERVSWKIGVLSTFKLQEL